MKTTLTNNSSMTLANSVRIGSMVTLLAAAGAVQTAHAGGIVRAWGFNDFGQCTVPTDLGACTAVAAGSYHSLALRQDGGVRAWGLNDSGQCTVPTDLGRCFAVAGGYAHSVALAFDPLDRNNNGTLDSVEISNDPTLDRNNNGIVDSWEIFENPMLDRNSNGILDSAEIAQNPTLDRDRNGILDSWELVNIVNADRNNNGVLDVAEVSEKDAQIVALTASNAALTARLNCGDLNGDGEVNGGDLGRMLISWGQCQ
jgi:hypothetical protein